MIAFKTGSVDKPNSTTRVEDKECPSLVERDEEGNLFVTVDDDGIFVDGDNIDMLIHDCGSRYKGTLQEEGKYHILIV